VTFSNASNILYANNSYINCTFVNGYNGLIVSAPNANLSIYNETLYNGTMDTLYFIVSIN
jgi:uncharacterized protein (UPF0333 family)